MPREERDDFNRAIHNPLVDVRPLMSEEIKDTTLHFGKGPKGWKLKDDEIYERVCDALYRHREIDASEIIVWVNDGVVTLSGKVPDREMKWEAENYVLDVSGVKDVHNEIQVQRTDEFGPDAPRIINH